MAEHRRGGHVYLVGAGPGDPDLLTVGAAKALVGADIILHDALIPQTALDGLPRGPHAEMVPVGKRAGEHLAAQEEINALIVTLARAGKNVVRLKGGDPFLFGRGSEEALACKAAGIRFTVIPGVTSAFAVPAYAGIPVTHRGLSGDVYIASPAASSGIDYVAAARAGTVILLMGAGGLGEACKAIEDAGRSPETPAAAIEWGTTPRQRSAQSTLSHLPSAVKAAALGTPLMVIMGDVVTLSEQLDWYQNGPLAGRSVGLTRSAPDAKELEQHLQAAGARAVTVPLIRYEFTVSPDDLGAWLEADWLAFTSANGVRAILHALALGGRDLRALAAVRLATLPGNTLATFEGLAPDFVAAEASSASLAAGLPAAPGETVVHICSDRAPSGFVKALAARGMHARQQVAYTTINVQPGQAELEELLACDAITFASPSAVESLVEALGGRPIGAAVRLVSLGATTSRAVQHGFGRVDGEAVEPTAAALAEAVLEALT
ncbi:MAG: uroporphyrinogen-III C-methyltransferase [Dehalococcoidia bacterium]